MKPVWSVIVLAAALVSAGAQAEDAAVARQREVAQGWLYTLQWVGKLTAQGHVWSHACQQGDQDVWTRAVAAIDRLYQRCVPARSAVARIVESKYAIDLLATANTSKRAVGTLAFERALAKESDAFGKADREKNCADPKGRRWLTSGYVDPADNWEWFDLTFPYKLGTDPSLAEQPCDALAAQEDPE